MSLLAPMGAPLGLGGGPSAMTGRFVRLAIAGYTETLSDLRGRLDGHAARIRDQVPATITEEMRKAVKRIKVRSPVGTVNRPPSRIPGSFRDGWKVEGKGWTVSVVNGTTEPPASYAAFVHKKGEKGRLFVEHYALPEIVRARARAVRRLRQMLREVAEPIKAGRARVRGGRIRL